ncbi:Uu.00g041350.m01.CDS01 [Anthostomella pinea]|uniref:Uu.00g041350.m01.CDS01 n=1 Tax=Anthostomella pinea TaxID=933095 RepID=A0AAI8VB14_9PEZI|nr:Uu.00g041350.m01.CDS01 [Anthostomella pinea]
MSTAASTTASPVDPAYAKESNAAWIVGVTTALHALALVCAGLRLYVKVWSTRAQGWDDAFMLLCAICAIGGWSVFIFQSYHGLGRHLDTIPTVDFVQFQHAAFWQTIISATASLMFLKVSISLSLLRLAFSKWYKWSLYFIIFSNVCFFISGSLTFLLFCQPMAGYWDKSLKPHCAPITTLVKGGLSNTVFNIITDVALATLPVPVIWRLKMNRRTKMSVIGILSLGYMAVAMGIVKAVYQIAYGTQKDKTFMQSVQFWGFLQLQVGIIAACAASLKPLFRRMLKLSSSGSGPHYKSGSGYGARKAPRSIGLVTIGGTGGTGSRPGAKNNQKFSSRAVDGDDDAGSDKSTLWLADGGGNHATTAKSGFYKNTTEGSTSEERILPRSLEPLHMKNEGERGGNGGIIRTTVVTVERES